MCLCKLYWHKQKPVNTQVMFGTYQPQLNLLQVPLITPSQLQHFSCFYTLLCRPHCEVYCRGDRYTTRSALSRAFISGNSQCNFSCAVSTPLIPSSDSRNRSFGNLYMSVSNVCWDWVPRSRHGSCLKQAGSTAPHFQQWNWKKDSALSS